VFAGTGIAIDVAAFAGIAKNEVNKNVTNKIAILFAQERFMVLSNS
jgi:hypothetical protein